MQINQPEHWPTTVEEALEVQRQLRDQVVIENRLGPIEYVAGVDVGFEEDGAVTRAAIAVLRLSDLKLVDQGIARRPTTFPYIPGFLSFREIPAVLDALAKLKIEPGILLCDGQGYAHPRRLGIAVHLGLLTDIPSIGVAKSWLIGKHDPLPEERGAWQPLHDKGEVIGAVLRTRDNTKPLYISSGHRISLPTALDYVMRCTPKYRLPETTRWAHKLASGKDEQPSALQEN
ncbi:MAG: deoxyribonuclease V [Chloroflexi bacterium]|nr:deoxyribonuclease V [Chloroflexota bacterium]